MFSVCRNGGILNGFAGANKNRFCEAEENTSNLLANNLFNLKNEVHQRPSFDLYSSGSHSSSTLLHASIDHRNSLLISPIPLFLSSIFTHPSWNWIIPSPSLIYLFLCAFLPCSHLISLFHPFLPENSLLILISPQAAAYRLTSETSTEHTFVAIFPPPCYF